VVEGTTDHSHETSSKIAEAVSRTSTITTILIGEAEGAEGGVVIEEEEEDEGTAAMGTILRTARIPVSDARKDRPIGLDRTRLPR
jgi:hypothetical protein